MVYNTQNYWVFGRWKKSKNPVNQYYCINIYVLCGSIVTCFDPDQVIIRQSLHECVTRFWIIYWYGSILVIYKFMFGLYYNCNC
jgi:hypothetical protein